MNYHDDLKARQMLMAQRADELIAQHLKREAKRRPQAVAMEPPPDPLPDEKQQIVQELLRRLGSRS